MSKRRGQQTKSITVNVTPEQAAAVGEMLELIIDSRRIVGVPTISKNDILLGMLQSHCIQMGVKWPEADTTLTEGRDNRGRFVKKS